MSLRLGKVGRTGDAFARKTEKRFDRLERDVRLVSMNRHRPRMAHSRVYDDTAPEIPLISRKLW